MQRFTITRGIPVSIIQCTVGSPANTEALHFITSNQTSKCYSLTRFGLSEVMLRRIVFPLLVVVAVVASYAVVTSAENTVEKKDDPELPRVLKTTVEEQGSIPLGEEERGVASLASRLKNLLRGRPTKAIDAQKNVDGANEAIGKVNSIIGRGKTSTELTPAKMKALETYARSNSDNWWAMAYFITNVLGIGLAVWFVYGTLFLGWRPIGLGGSPRAN